MDKILVLHGAIGAKEQMLPLAKALEEKYEVHTPDFIGHGEAADTGEAFSIKLFAEQVLEYIQEQNIDKANIFGYSMGGYVGMWLAKHHPQNINKLITLATKFYWDETVATNEIKFLDPWKIEQKLPAFAMELQKRHSALDWKTVLDRTRTMLVSMGEKNPLQLDDYKEINIPCLLLLGDRDKMITLDETIAVYKQLPNAQFGILPGTPHPVEQVDVDVVSFLVKQFFK